MQSYSSLVLLLLLPLIGWSQTSQKTIAVIGVGKMEVNPNFIEVEIELRKTRRDRLTPPKEFFTNLLKTLELQDDQLLAQNSYGYRWQALRGKGSSWRYNYVYLLRLKSLTEANKFLSQSKQITDKASFRITQVTHTQIDSLKLAAKVLAMKSAKEKASKLLNAINASLGEVIQVVEAPPAPDTYKYSQNRLEKIMLECKIQVKFTIK